MYFFGTRLRKRQKKVHCTFRCNLPYVRRSIILSLSLLYLFIYSSVCRNQHQFMDSGTYATYLRRIVDFHTRNCYIWYIYLYVCTIRTDKLIIWQPRKVSLPISFFIKKKIILYCSFEIDTLIRMIYGRNPILKTWVFFQYYNNILVVKNL